MPYSWEGNRRSGITLAMRHCLQWLMQSQVQGLRPLSHGKLIFKFMFISSFRKKISSVNSQLSKEINFEILFHNLEHVLFCEIIRKNFTYGAL